MILLNPHRHERKYPDERSRQIMLKTIEFFEEKGLNRSNSDLQKELALKVVRTPVPNERRFNRVWTHHVYALRDQYKMSK